MSIYTLINNFTVNNNNKENFQTNSGIHDINTSISTIFVDQMRAHIVVKREKNILCWHPNFQHFNTKSENP
jgi:hypothetical protein